MIYDVQFTADMALPGLGRSSAGLYITFARRIGQSSSLPSCYPQRQTLRVCSPCLSPLGTRSLHILDVQSSFTDYEHERRTFNLTVPQRFNFARDVIDVWASAEQVLALVFVLSICTHVLQHSFTTDTDVHVHALWI